MATRFLLDKAIKGWSTSRPQRHSELIVFAFGEIVHQSVQYKRREMALPKAKEMVSSNPVVVFRSVPPFFLTLFCGGFMQNPLLLSSFSIGTDRTDGSLGKYSKSYCPFCKSVKKLLTEAGAAYKAIELDVESLFSSPSLFRFD